MNTQRQNGTRYYPFLQVKLFFYLHHKKKTSVDSPGLESFWLNFFLQVSGTARTLNKKLLFFWHLNQSFVRWHYFFFYVLQSFADTQCSGRSHCNFRVSEPMHIGIGPCPLELAHYLEIAYICQHGKSKLNNFLIMFHASVHKLIGKIHLILFDLTLGEISHRVRIFSTTIA